MVWSGRRERLGEVSLLALLLLLLLLLLLEEEEKFDPKYKGRGSAGRRERWYENLSPNAKQRPLSTVGMRPMAFFTLSCSSQPRKNLALELVPFLLAPPALLLLRPFRLWAGMATSMG